MAGLFLTGINDTSISAGSSPARPAAGQHATATVQVGNSGGTSGAFSLLGALVLSGSSTTEGHLGQNGSPTSPVSGIVPAGGSPASVTVFSGPLATANQFAGYNPSAGFDLLLTLTDTASGAATVYIVASAVFAPPAPATLAIVGVTLGVA